MTQIWSLGGKTEWLTEEERGWSKRRCQCFVKLDNYVSWGQERRRAMIHKVKKWVELWRKKHKERLGNDVRVKRVRKRQRLYILPIPPGLASSLFIASHIKVSSLIFSTADIVISPAEVIHHHCNITLSLSLPPLFLLYLYHHSGLLVSCSPMFSLLFQPSLVPPSTASFFQFPYSKTAVPKVKSFNRLSKEMSRPGIRLRGAVWS